MAGSSTHWQQTDAELHRAAIALASVDGPDEVARIIARRIPWLARQIGAVSHCRAVLDFWGSSSPVDDNAQESILGPAVLRYLAAETGARLGARAAHAGVLHTYGYLVSAIETPYGRKRDRWVTPRIENGLRIGPGLVRARPTTGSLLFNLTYLLWSIVQHGDSAALARLEPLVEHTAPALARLRYDRFRRARIRERIIGGSTPLELVTDLVGFARGRGWPRASLLIYSLRVGDELSLITCFHTTARTVADRLAEPCGRSVTIEPRYNAVLPGRMTSARGRRSIEFSPDLV